MWVRAQLRPTCCEPGQFTSSSLLRWPERYLVCCWGECYKLGADRQCAGWQVWMRRNDRDDFPIAAVIINGRRFDLWEKHYIYIYKYWLLIDKRNNLCWYVLPLIKLSGSNYVFNLFLPLWQESKQKLWVTMI